MPSNNETTTKFKVDISELKSAMQTARRETALAKSEFKAVSSTLENWGKSTTGVKAKLTQLQSNLKSQRTVLAQYEKTLEEVKAEYGENSAEAMEYQTKLNNQKAIVNQTEREIAKYTQILADLESETDKAGESTEDLGDSLEDVDGATDKAKEGFTVLKGALANLVADGFRKAIDSAKEFTRSMIESAATVKAENSQFTQTFGDLESEASKSIKGIADSTGILDTRLRGTGANIYAFARSSGASTKEAMELMKTSLIATADASAYYDRSLEDTSETLMSFLKGNFSNDAALGVSATEFTRNAKATELFGKKYNELSEIQKQQTLLRMVTDAQKLSGAMGQAQREADGWENVQGNLNEAWRQFQAEVGTPVLESLIPVVQDLTARLQEMTKGVDWESFGASVKRVANVLVTAFGWVLDNGSTLISILGGIVAGFVAFKTATVIMSVISMFKTLFMAVKMGIPIMEALNLTLLANPIVLIITLVAGLVAAFILLWKTNENFRNFFISAWEKIKQAFTTAITFIINTIKTLPTILPKFLTLVISKIISWGTTLASKGRQAGSRLVSAVADTVKTLPNKIKSIGGDVVAGLWNGITNKADWLKGKIKSFVGDVTSWLKKFFKIGSPSRLMANEIGQWLPAGIGVGIEDNMKSLYSSMKTMGSVAMNGLDSGLSTSVGGAGGVINNFNQTINAPKQLDRLTIYRQSKNLLGYAGGGM